MNFTLEVRNQIGKTLTGSYKSMISNQFRPQLLLHIKRRICQEAGLVYDKVTGTDGDFLKFLGWKIGRLLLGKKGKKAREAKGDDDNDDDEDDDDEDDEDDADDDDDDDDDEDEDEPALLDDVPDATRLRDDPKRPFTGFFRETAKVWKMSKDIAQTSAKMGSIIRALDSLARSPKSDGIKDKLEEHFMPGIFLHL